MGVKCTLLVLGLSNTENCILQVRYFFFTYFTEALSGDANGGQERTAVSREEVQALSFFH